MKTIIIEDEQYAALRLESLIRQYDPAIEIVARLESVEESVEWLKAHPHPDLIFLDIHLEDGLSFAIFDKVKVDVPIIFTTAFDEYAIQAFRLRSIDYLLKPIGQEDLNRAIDKYRNWKGKESPVVDLTGLYELLGRQNKPYRERFSVTVGERIKTIEVKQIHYFFSISGITFAVMNDRHQYSLDLSLDRLSECLNPGEFFRINRQFLLAHRALAHVHIYPKSRLKLELNPPASDEVFVSIDKVVEFKQWLDGR